MFHYIFRLAFQHLVFIYEEIHVQDFLCNKHRDCYYSFLFFTNWNKLAISWLDSQVFQTTGPSRLVFAILMQSTTYNK